MLHNKATNGSWWRMENQAQHLTGSKKAPFSPDGKHLAYAAQQGDKWFAVTDGTPGPTYDGIAYGTLLFSPDSRRLVYAAHQGDKWFMVVDGITSPAYDGFISGGHPVFDNSSSLHVLVRKDRTIYIAQFTIKVN